MKVLLLNSTYQAINFVSQRKALKLFVKGKVDILSSWDRKVRWARGEMFAPATIKLKYYVRWIPKKSRFNRIGVFKRDHNTCMYCNNVFKHLDLTIDHVIPQSRGGKSNWQNCVTSCYACNNKKADRTPEEAKMKIISQPVVPSLNISHELIFMNRTHDDWYMYLGVEK